MGKAGWRLPATRRGRIIAGVCVALVLLCGFVGVFSGVVITQPIGGGSSTILFTVAPGETADAVASRLQRQGLVRNTLLFSVLARADHVPSPVPPGIYRLRASMGMDGVVAKFAAGHPDAVVITIPAGLRVTQYTQALGTQLTHVAASDFTRIVTTGAVAGGQTLAQRFWYVAPRGAHVPYALEGYLLPGTYTLDTSGTAGDVVTQMVTALGEQLCPGPDAAHRDAYLHDAAQCKAHAATVQMGGQAVSVFAAMERTFATSDDRLALYDTLTLASIVARERNTSAEDAAIASVYYQRYALSQSGGLDPAGDSVGFLDAPSTVEYARDSDHAPASGGWWAPLAGAAVSIDPASPYNTAVTSNTGLPPGPIAAPDWDAIVAASTASADVAAGQPASYFLESICGATDYATSAAEFQGVRIKAQYEANAGCRSPLLAVPAPTPVAIPAPTGPLPAITAAPADSAAAVFLMNPDTGAVYLAQHANDERAMASTTKIMTALVAVTYGHLDQRITVGPNVIAELAGTGASVAYLRVGDTLTLQQLLYGLLLPSGDDAAIAIADGVGGSEPGFVWLMNDEARLLGLTHTHYENVHGLDQDGHYSSAADLARLATFVLRSPAIAPVVGSATYALPQTADHGPYAWSNTNLLLFPPVYPGILGVKTGFTGNAGECLVFAASSQYGRVVGVVLYEPSADARFADARALLTWGFSVEAHEDAARHAVGLGAG